QLAGQHPPSASRWRTSGAGCLTDGAPLGDLEQPQSLFFGEIAVEMNGAMKVVERHLEFRALARVHEVAMGQHGGSAADGGTVDGCDQRRVETSQRNHRWRPRSICRPWRVLEKS